MENDSSWTSVLVDQSATTAPSETPTEPTAPEGLAPPEVDAALLRARVDRMRQGCFHAAICAAPVVFVVMLVIVGIANWRPEYSLIGHVFETIVSCAGGALMVGGFMWLAFTMGTRGYAARLETLLRDGIVVPACGLHRSVWGVYQTRRVLGKSVERLWGPLAKALSLKIPTMYVAGQFERNGKKGTCGEMFFGDEVPFVDAEGREWVLVHPKKDWFTCILRQPGEFSL